MKRKNLYTYPAIFTFEDSQYWVEFIDLEGCFSDGVTLSDAMENAKEAMGLYLEDLEIFPEPTIDIKNVKLNDNQVISFVTVNLDEHRKKYETRSVKKTLSIPAWLNTEAEKANVNFSQLLQKALIESLKIDVSNKK
ncbi:MAG: type II toxin-antitoxin system HicB family antitoxin [Clostridia bacterium]|nr:type II toxin-antitoxin system HicB family antitoxin [Clostridia bacterium]